MVVPVGGVNFRSGHRVKRRLSGSVGRLCEETQPDVHSRMNFPQCKQKVGGIFFRKETSCKEMTQKSKPFTFSDIT